MGDQGTFTIELNQALKDDENLAGRTGELGPLGRGFYRKEETGGSRNYKGAKL